jgi:hypothetical protein
MTSNVVPLADRNAKDKTLPGPRESDDRPTHVSVSWKKVEVAAASIPPEHHRREPAGGDGHHRGGEAIEHAMVARR